MNRARDDTPLIWEDSAGPQEFDLVGTSNKGCLRKSVFDQIKALEETVDSSFDLIYNGNTIPVVFRHWEEGPVVYGEPLGKREGLTSEDFMINIRIKLMEV